MNDTPWYDDKQKMDWMAIGIFAGVFGIFIYLLVFGLL